MVIVLGMNTLDRLGQNGDYIAIATDIVVVGGLTEASDASSNEAFDGEGLVAATARAVDDQELHGLVLERLQILIHFTRILKCHTALDGDGAEDRGDYGGNEFKHLHNGVPICFNHNSHSFLVSII